LVQTAREPVSAPLQVPAGADSAALLVIQVGAELARSFCCRFRVKLELSMEDEAGGQTYSNAKLGVVAGSTAACPAAPLPRLVAERSSSLFPVK